MHRDQHRARIKAPGADPASARPSRPRGRVAATDELRKSTARARRAEIALVSSYLRALRRLGEVPLTPSRPEMPH